jgi:hypothetical protein
MIADGTTANLQDNSEVRNAFQKAKEGAVEFYADGVFVHIRNDEYQAGCSACGK